jgi:hypothetical protein
MSLEVRMLSAEEAAAWKRDSRAADERSLKSGQATAEDLQRKNSAFRGAPELRPRLDQAVPLE